MSYNLFLLLIITQLLKWNWNIFINLTFILWLINHISIYAYLCLCTETSFLNLQIALMIIFNNLFSKIISLFKNHLLTWFFHFFLNLNFLLRTDKQLSDFILNLSNFIIKKFEFSYFIEGRTLFRIYNE